jgi:hypothetical protein
VHGVGLYVIHWVPCHVLCEAAELHQGYVGHVLQPALGMQHGTFAAAS